ncbi:MAG: archease [Planctomycetota bacterium]
MSDQTEKTGWEHFPHQADIGVRGWGLTIEQAFEQVAVALTAVITEPDKVRPAQKVEIQCNAQDRELLLVDWLSSVLYEMATRKMLFSRFEVNIGKNHLTAAAWGQQIEISTWVAQCVVDV